MKYYYYKMRTICYNIVIHGKYLVLNSTIIKKFLIKRVVSEFLKKINCHIFMLALKYRNHTTCFSLNCLVFVYDLYFILFYFYFL